MSDLSSSAGAPGGGRGADGAGSGPVTAFDRGIREGDIGYVSLWVPDAERAMAFFSRVLGWTYLPTTEGRTAQVAGRALPHGVDGGHDSSNLFLCFVVEDIDAARQRVSDAGGVADEATEESHGRTALCADGEGTACALFQPPPGRRGERRAVNGTDQGDLAYVTMEVRDSAIARAFYGAVLGWRFQPGRVEDGWGPEDVVPMTGLSGGHDLATVVPMYRVDDMAVTVARVRGAGGSATEPTTEPYGLSSQCVDDQGTRFYLGQLPSD